MNPEGTAHSWTMSSSTLQSSKELSWISLGSHRLQQGMMPQLDKDTMVQQSRQVSRESETKVDGVVSERQNVPGRYRLMTNGIFFAASSFNAISRGSVSPSTGTKTGAFILANQLCFGKARHSAPRLVSIEPMARSICRDR